MLYIVKYKRNEKEKSILFISIKNVKIFCEKLLSIGIKPIIEVEKGKIGYNEEEKRIILENLIEAYKEFIDLPNEVIEKAKELCNISFKESPTHPLDIDFILAGAIYASFEMLGIPKTKKEIANALPFIDDFGIENAYDSLMDTLDKIKEREIEEEEINEWEIEEEVKEETAPLKEEIKEMKALLSSKDILFAFLKSASIIAIISIILYFIIHFIRW